jgi:hypothetical protein
MDIYARMSPTHTRLFALELYLTFDGNPFVCITLAKKSYRKDQRILFGHVLEPHRFSCISGAKNS